jgi:hypothetical protein
MTPLFVDDDVCMQHACMAHGNVDVHDACKEFKLEEEDERVSTYY